MCESLLLKALGLLSLYNITKCKTVSKVKR